MHPTPTLTATPQQAAKALVDLIHAADARDEEHGYLGILNEAETAYLFFIEEKPGYIHCLIEDGLSLEYAECLTRIALDPYVRVKFKKINGVLVAVDFDDVKAAQLYQWSGASLRVPALPPASHGAIQPPPTFGDPTVKILDAGVVSVGALDEAYQRYLWIAAESGTADDLIEIEGLAVGDEVIIRADTGDTITVKNNDAGATDKILLSGGTDIDLSGTETLKLVKLASGEVVQYVGAGGNAASVSYTPTAPLTETNVQDALDEVAALLGIGGAGSTPFFSGRLPSDAANITFDPIPQTHKHLLLFLSGRSTLAAATDDWRIQAEGDTTAGNYFGTYFGYTNTSTAAAQNNGATATLALTVLPAASATANLFGGLWLVIFDYTDATKIKAAKWSSMWSTALSSGGMSAREGQGQWNDTDAITEMVAFAAGGDLAAGTAYALYGFN